WMLRASPALQQRWVKILPHLVDTALLASAITLAVWSGQSPGSQPWLAAKLCALLAYIVLGTIALKRGKTPAVRGAAFALAVLVFAYIVAVAVTKQAWPL
ncbi:MAG: SirB2 family protein, partial [Janthinobacterium sp.]